MSHIKSAARAPHAELFLRNDSYHAYALVEAVEEAKLGCNYLSRPLGIILPIAVCCLKWIGNPGPRLRTI
jgi:uncharacterized protein YcaQ